MSAGFFSEGTFHPAGACPWQAKLVLQVALAADQHTSSLLGSCLAMRSTLSQTEVQRWLQCECNYCERSGCSLPRHWSQPTLEVSSRMFLCFSGVCSHAQSAIPADSRASGLQGLSEEVLVLAHQCAVNRGLPASKAWLSSWLKCRKEIDKDVSRLVESGDECERPQSAPPQFDAVSSGLPRVRRGRTSQLPSSREKACRKDSSP